MGHHDIVQAISSTKLPKFVYSVHEETKETNFCELKEICEIEI